MPTHWTAILAVLAGCCGLCGLLAYRGADRESGRMLMVVGFIAALVALHLYLVKGRV